MWLTLSASLLTGPALAEDSPDKVVEYRQVVMKSMGSHMKASAMVVKGEVARSADLVAHASAIHQTSLFLTDLFPEGTGPGVGKTSAKGSVWSDWDGFEAANTALTTESAKLLDVAKTGDLDVYRAQFGAVGKTCGACHDDHKVDED